MGVRRTLLAVSAMQAAFYVLAWLSPDGTIGQNFVKLVQTGDIF